LAECGGRVLVSGGSRQMVLFQLPDVARATLAPCRGGFVRSGGGGAMELAGNFFRRAAHRHHQFQRTAGLGAGLAFAHTLAPVIAAEVLRSRIVRSEPFCRVTDVIYIGLAACLTGTIAATVCATAICAREYAPFNVLLSRWFDWTLSDAGVALLLTPFLLLSGARPSFVQVIRKQPGAFLISTATSVLAVGYLLFGTSGIRAADAGASFLILLPLLWMAVRLSLQLAYPAFVVVMIATIVGTMSGFGPFYGVEHGGKLVIFAQMAIGFGASVLLLGGASNEQRAAEDQLRKLNLDLEGRVEQRTGELREIQRQLEKAAFYDPLTGLPNRRLLEERFAFCAAAARRKVARFTILLTQLRTSPSIGVARYPENGETWQAIYKAADLAVYHAKRAGRRTWQWYVPELSIGHRD
jgi:integral membrane sensor domain MASE1